MKILITGGNGYVGKSLYNLLKEQYEITSITRNDFDLTSSEAMSRFFQGKYFDVVLHCAAVGGSRLRIDSYRDMDINLTMYYNLLQYKPHYTKLIYFGSGAEINDPDTPYGLSKKVISNSVSEIDNFYNLRIYAVFDENELETRFIKTCIRNYITRNPIEIFKDKKMDFFYMSDLAMLVNHYITNSKLPKVVNCNYRYVKSLLDIVEIVNKLEDYKAPIIVHSQSKDKPYCGTFTDLGIKFAGLEEGIKNTYIKLK